MVNMLIVATTILTWAAIAWIAFRLIKNQKAQPPKWHIGSREDARDDNGHMRNSHADNDL